MANIRCEICGSSEIRKSGDDSFICQGCGIKYSKDDILKLLDVNTEDKREENNEPAESAETENEADKQLEGSILPDETQEECFEENIDEPAAVSTDVKADDANRKNVKRTAIAIIGFVVIAAVIGIICAWAGKDSPASDTIESDVLDYNDSVTFGWDDNDYETADESGEISETEFINRIKSELEDLNYLEAEVIEDKTVNVSFTFDGLAVSVIKMENNSLSREAWTKTKNLAYSTYIIVKDIADSCGYSDYNIGVTVKNDLYRDRSFYVSLNGVTLYDYLNQ